MSDKNVDLNVGEPAFVQVQCQDCWHEWQGFFPDGISFDTPVECPKCGKMRGMLLPKNEYRKE